MEPWAVPTLQAGLFPTLMMETAPERVVDLIRDGRKIEAVKLVREETGVSLKDALEAVELIERGESPAVAADEGGDPMPEVEALALQGRKIEAIALLRQRSGLGLKEAKDVVDALPHPEITASPRLALAVVVALVIMGFAVFLAVMAG